MIEISYDLINGQDLCNLLEHYSGYLDGDKKCLVITGDVKHGN